MNIESIKQCIEKIEKELAELKIYVDEVKVKETHNQLRSEIIEKAKSFVEIKSNYLRDSSECDGGFDAKFRENPNYCTFVMKCVFIVNAEKRTVVAILKYLNNSIRAKSIVKCNQSDVFNEHIGKAIALGRVLKLDVSEFEHAVQPNSKVLGMLIKQTENNEIMRLSNNYGYDVDGIWRCGVGSNFSDSGTIIDDTNAFYEGEVE